MSTYKTLLAACNEKIESWNSIPPVNYEETFSCEEIEAMMDWMSGDCPFDIDVEYFLRIEECSGYEVMREEVVTNYIRRNLMYMIDQIDTKTAERWYHLWKNIFR